MIVATSPLLINLDNAYDRPHVIYHNKALHTAFKHPHFGIGHHFMRTGCQRLWAGHIRNGDLFYISTFYQ